MKIYNIFISHSWAYPDAYDKLVSLLKNAPNFPHINHSVPKDDPIHNAPNAQALYNAIYYKMQPCDCVLVLAGVYATYSTWINHEIKIAQGTLLTRKPIIAIEPWAAEKTSSVVKNAANKIVGWNTNSVVQAIRELC